MTATLTTATFSNASDATWRAWATIVHNAIIAAGLVNTADTGQVDFTTATRSNVGRYKMYRFNDALQGTAPIFLKVDYAISPGSNTWGLHIAAGFATDGAGNLIGEQSDRMGRSLATGDESAARKLLVSGDGGRLMIAMDYDTSIGARTNFQVYVIERSRDTTGAYDATGVWTIVLGGGGGYFRNEGRNSNHGLGVTQFTFRTGPQAFYMLGVNTSMFSAATQDNANVAHNRWLRNGVATVGTVTYPWGAPNPPISIVFPGYYDFAGGQSYTVNIYGVARTYYCANDMVIGNQGSIAVNSTGAGGSGWIGLMLLAE